MPVVITMDGGCKKPGTPQCFALGAAAAIKDGQVIEVMHLKEDTASTHQRAELMGAVAALELASKYESSVLVTDSMYVKQAIYNKWWASWESNGWITSEGTPVVNKDLWEQIALKTSQCSDYMIYHVKGHVATIGEKTSQNIYEGDDGRNALLQAIVERFEGQKVRNGQKRYEQAFEAFPELNGIEPHRESFDKFIVANVFIDTVVRYLVSTYENIWRG